MLLLNVSSTAIVHVDLTANRHSGVRANIKSHWLTRVFLAVDPGVLVRKTVVKVLTQAMNTPENVDFAVQHMPVMVHLLMRMLWRAHDPYEEDSVKDAILEGLQTCLFAADVTGNKLADIGALADAQHKSLVARFRRVQALLLALRDAKSRAMNLEEVVVGLLGQMLDAKTSAAAATQGDEASTTTARPTAAQRRLQQAQSATDRTLQGIVAIAVPYISALQNCFALTEQASGAAVPGVDLSSWPTTAPLSLLKPALKQQAAADVNYVHSELMSALAVLRVIGRAKPSLLQSVADTVFPMLKVRGLVGTSM